MSQKTGCQPYRRLAAILIFSIAFFTYIPSYSQNPIVTENLLPGTPASVWDIPTKDAGDLTIQGFATEISVNRGGTINFKIDVNSGTNKNFTIDIYRIGYYQGNGARLIANLGTVTGIAQAACSFDALTGLTECGNWTLTTSWAVPATAVSGLYIAKLTRAAGGGTSHIPFVVRNDASTADIMVKTSDATWQAYNGYGGYSLYQGPGTPNDHGTKVSYNRPFITRSGGGGGGANEDWFMNAEYPMIRFLESNGYDLSYTTDLDIARDNANNVNLLLGHKIFLSVGHDEYWSKEVRNSVEAAKAAGKNLAFFSGNEVYWKTRWENSVDGNNTPFRTMVCYKEGSLPTLAEKACGDKCDISTDEWTGLWRDGCNYAGVTDACKPENALSGEMSWDGTTSSIMVPSTYKNLRFWRNTPVVANLAVGATATLPLGTLGYEWDWEQYANSYPPGRVTMSSTDFDGHTHKLSLYKAPSGSIVFGAGTVQWAWGLDQNHDINSQGGGGPANQDMQQATINVLADMGAIPATLQSPLVAATPSTDATAPVSVISVPVNGAAIPQGSIYVISGTATDVGGIVAGVEVSVDNGATWNAATGTTNWTYQWLPSTLGPTTIKCRSFDDIGNLELPGGSEGSANTVNVTVVTGIPPTDCPCSVFLPSEAPDNGNAETNLNDGHDITLGVKFKAAFDGTIAGIRFYKSVDDNSTTEEYVRLYSLSPDGGTTPGTILGEAHFPVGYVATPGWNEIFFSSPISITANTVYVASVYSPEGFYSQTLNALLNPIVRGPLALLKDGDQGPNGNFLFTGPPDAPNSEGYPIDGFFASNYWVDVDYSNGPDITPPIVIANLPGAGATNVNFNTSASVIFSERIDSTSVTTTNFSMKDALNNNIPATVSYSLNTNTASLIPALPLDYSTTYTVTVKGGGTGIKDPSGNHMMADFIWSFTTSPPPAVPPDEGGGGPVLIISNSFIPYSRYPVEMLRAQGFNGFRAVDITEVNAAMLDSFDVILLGNMTVTAAQASMFTNWTNAGGTLIAQRPSSLLLPLMGVTSSGTKPDNITNTYLMVNTAAGLPGAGIVNQTIQYHGVADLYTMLAGTTSLATLYNSATVASTNPAITIHNVGTNGGKAIAFAYDLPKSIVFTRQGNLSWAGISKDGQSGPIRSDNLFYPNFIDLNKVQIPQADEQQHLLTNIIQLSNLHRKPMPHLWLLPGDNKAAVIMTGDDHNNGSYLPSSGTAGRFNEYIEISELNNNNTPQAIEDWKAIRGTSYVYNDISMSDDSVRYYQDLGFEIALHPNTNCTNFTQASLTSDMASQQLELHAQFPGLDQILTNRTHCMPWSDWASHAKVENSLGVRFDVNYYYWPGIWVQNRPGMFTGSGFPMRFSDMDGTIIDVYQAPTQMPDESQLNIPSSINTLLDNAINLGYYGAFVMNMHTDTAIHFGSDQIIAAAQARNVPVITSKQMLTWLDNRNSTIFSHMTWLDSKLSFDLTTSAHNLRAIVPFNSADGSLIQVTENDLPISFATETIKGIQYGVFPASTNSYVAIYSSTALPVTLLNFTATKQGDDARLNWSTSMEDNNQGFEIQRSSDASTWKALGFIAGAGTSQVQHDYQYLDLNLPAGTYYYRLRQVDYDGHSKFSKIVPLTFDGGLALELKQNRPNPFNSYTTIQMVIPKYCQVQLILYDQMGRAVQQLVDEFKQAGKYDIQVNKNGLAPGIYYYRMNAMGQSITKKMTIL